MHVPIDHNMFYRNMVPIYAHSIHMCTTKFLHSKHSTVFTLLYIIIIIPADEINSKIELQHYT